MICCGLYTSATSICFMHQSDVTGGRSFSESFITKIPVWQIRLIVRQHPLQPG